MNTARERGKTRLDELMKSTVDSTAGFITGGRSLESQDPSDDNGTPSADESAPTEEPQPDTAPADMSSSAQDTDAAPREAVADEKADPEQGDSGNDTKSKPKRRPTRPSKRGADIAQPTPASKKLARSKYTLALPADLLDRLHGVEVQEVTTLGRRTQRWQHLDAALTSWLPAPDEIGDEPEGEWVTVGTLLQEDTRKAMTVLAVTVSGPRSAVSVRAVQAEAVSRYLDRLAEPNAWF